MKILPITALRDTQKILEEALGSNEPIHISKNGADSLVLMSESVYSLLGQPSFSKKPKYDIGRNAPQKEIKSIEYGDRASSSQSDPLGFVRVRSASLPIKIANPKARLWVLTL